MLTTTFNRPYSTPASDYSPHPLQKIIKLADHRGVADVPGRAKLGGRPGWLTITTPTSPPTNTGAARAPARTFASVERFATVTPKSPQARAPTRQPADGA
ncbi:hypothetical protein [Streptomyces sp. NPDC001500]